MVEAAPRPIPAEYVPIQQPLSGGVFDSKTLIDSQSLSQSDQATLSGVVADKKHFPRVDGAINIWGPEGHVIKFVSKDVNGSFLTSEVSAEQWNGMNDIEKIAFRQTRPSVESAEAAGA